MKISSWKLIRRNQPVLVLLWSRKSRPSSFSSQFLRPYEGHAFYKVKHGRASPPPLATHNHTSRILERREINGWPVRRRWLTSRHVIIYARRTLGCRANRFAKLLLEEVCSRNRVNSLVNLKGVANLFSLRDFLEFFFSINLDRGCYAFERITNNSNFLFLNRA